MSGTKGFLLVAMLLGAMFLGAQARNGFVGARAQHQQGGSTPGGKFA